MKKTNAILAVLVATSFAVSFGAQAVELTGAPAKALFTSLVQTDVKTTEITQLVVPGKPQDGEQVVEQKISVTNLDCKTAYTGIGIMTGACTGKDMNGTPFTSGSAASAQIISALPDGFGEGSTGHFTGHASSITCEIDARTPDSTGTAVATCAVL
jgi:hypothetical protein